jgi:hypothetical protein
MYLWLYSPLLDLCRLFISWKFTQAVELLGRVMTGIHVSSGIRNLDPSVWTGGLIFLRWGVVSPKPKPQAEGPPLVGCPRLFIQYIRSYAPYLEVVSFIRHLRTRHAVVTMDPINMEGAHNMLIKLSFTKNNEGCGWREKGKSRKQCEKPTC